jgi:hypothetical protein
VSSHLFQLVKQISIISNPHISNRKGLIYLEVPIDDGDHVVVPPLEGFVMNRVLGDYFETLLYKIFVSIDEHTSVSEVPNLYTY